MANYLYELYHNIEFPGRFALQKQLRRELLYDSKAIEAMQVRLIRFLVGHAMKTVPYYRELFRKIGLDDANDVTLGSFASIPCITKDIIRENFNELRSSDYDIDETIRSRTGGTTSTPMEFLIDRKSYVRRFCSTELYNSWFGFTPGDRMMIIWGARQDYEDPGFKTRLVNDYIKKTRFLASNLLNDSTFQSFYDDIRAYAPKMLQSYTNPLVMFSKFLMTNGLSLDVDVVQCTAEALSDEDRRVIEEAFGKKIFHWYGSRELGRIATECGDHSGMHINENCLYCEFKSIPGNDLKEIIATDLHNYAMPFIRYATNDMCEEGGCVCGCKSAFKKINKLVGRVSDVFINKKKQYIPSVALTCRLFVDNSVFSKIQIIQHWYDKFEIKCVVNGELTEEKKRFAVGRINEFTEQENEVVFSVVEDIPQEASGKTIFAKRNFSES